MPTPTETSLYRSLSSFAQASNKVHSSPHQHHGLELFSGNWSYESVTMLGGDTCSYIKTTATTSRQALESTDAWCQVDMSCAVDNCTVSCRHEVLQAELHIALHPTYQVPGPYIRICTSSGNVLSSVEVQSMLTSLSSQAVLSEANYILTEHPVLGTPFTTLHICGIEEILSLLRDKAEDPLLLLKWFSVVGPHVGRPMTPLEYNNIAKELRNMEKNCSFTII